MALLLRNSGGILSTALLAQKEGIQIRMEEDGDQNKLKQVLKSIKESTNHLC